MQYETEWPAGESKETGRSLLGQPPFAVGADEDAKADRPGPLWTTMKPLVLDHYGPLWTAIGRNIPDKIAIAMLDRIAAGAAIPGWAEWAAAKAALLSASLKPAERIRTPT